MPGLVYKVILFSFQSNLLASVSTVGAVIRRISRINVNPLIVVENFSDYS